MSKRTPDKSGDRRSSDLLILRRIIGEAKPWRWWLAAIFALGLLATPLALLQPVPLKVIIDHVIGSEALPGVFGEWLPPGEAGYGTGLLLAAVILLLLVKLLSQAQGMSFGLLQTWVGDRITLQMRSRLLGHAQRLSFGFHDSRGTHDSIYRINYDAAAIQQVVVSNLLDFVTSTITLVSMIVVMVAINVELSLIAMTVIPLLFWVARAYGKRMRPRYKEAHKLESSALGVVQEVLTSFRVVKAFGREEHEERRFLHHSDLGIRARLRLGLFEGVFGILVGLTTACGSAGVLFVGVQQVKAGALSLGELLVIVNYLGMLYGPVRTISKRVANLQKQLARAERAFELLDAVPDVVEKPDAVPITRARGAVQLDGVTFGYDAGLPVLRDVSFRVDPGARVGIVGKTGAGKTTLISLLTRFYDPDEGAVLLDGRDLTDYRLADLRRQFSIVLQEPVLLATSVAENIAYARPEAAHEEIVAAARAADAHDFIEAMPEGYDTVVGERGMRLSGGERQRISLARAFLKDAPILILDEPTSSVDVVTEASIMATMQRLMHGRTTFMIAHRLSTLEGCDLLLELDQGRLRMSGTGVGESRVVPAPSDTSRRGGS